MRLRNYVILAVILLCCSIGAMAAQKPCIAFSGGQRHNPAEETAKEKLSVAVTLSGDFDFVDHTQLGCWTVNVIAVDVKVSGRNVGTAMSYVVTDQMSVFIDHELEMGQADIIVDDLMRDAAAAAIKDIRKGQ